MAENEQRKSVNGRPAAAIDWPALLAEHRRWLRTVAYARLRERDAVEDVMQEVALAAVRQTAPLQDPAKVGPWLYRLVVRQALLYRRRCGRRRRMEVAYRERARSDASRTGNPLDWLLTDERRALVRLALQHLREGDAEILMLKYTEGWKYSRIAAHLGVTTSTVEARLHRARQRMRRELSKLNVAEAAR